jgi:hypothetical protein
MRLENEAQQAALRAENEARLAALRAEKEAFAQVLALLTRPAYGPLCLSARTSTPIVPCPSSLPSTLCVQRPMLKLHIEESLDLPCEVNSLVYLRGKSNAQGPPCGVARSC